MLRFLRIDATAVDLVAVGSQSESASFVSAGSGYSFRIDWELWSI